MKFSNSRLLFTAIFLFLLYLLSFFMNTGMKRKALKTALINPKYKSEITNITLSYKGESLILEKKNDFWFVKAYEDSPYLLAAENECVENFIGELIKIRNLYKISDRLPESNNFGFEKDHCFYIKCNYNDTFSEFYFGNQDFSEVFRFFMTGKNTKVYQLDSSFEKYLSVSENFWCQKTIISKSLCKISSYEDLQSVSLNGKKITSQNEDFTSYCKNLLDLRHGGSIIAVSDLKAILSSECLARLSIELGNKNSISLKVYEIPRENQEYALFVNYDNSKIQCLYKISGWTLSKILQN